MVTPTQPDAPVDRLNVGSSPKATSSPWRRAGGAGGGARPDQLKNMASQQRLRACRPRRYALMILLAALAEPLWGAGEARQGPRGKRLGGPGANVAGRRTMVAARLRCLIATVK